MTRRTSPLPSRWTHALTLTSSEGLDNLCGLLDPEALRRLKRICAFYGARPQFICASATICNPVDLAERLTEEPFRLVGPEQDGSPAGEKHFLFYNPPIVDRDLGIRRSVGEYMLLLNSDTEIMPGAVTGLLDFLISHPEVGAVGPRILNPDSSLQYSCSPAPTLRGEFRRLFHLPGIRHDGYYEMRDWNQDSPHPTDILLGACIMLPRRALEQVGLMDED